MKLLPMIVVCDKCNFKNTEYVSPAPDTSYTGTILRSFYCKGWNYEKGETCRTPQVIRYKFNDKGSPEVVSHIEPSEIFIEREQPTGITIKPKSKSR